MEAALIVKTESMDQTHPPSAVVAADVLVLVILLLRQILCDNKQ